MELTPRARQISQNGFSMLRFLMVLLLAGLAPAQSPRTVLDGVFTAAQAARGEGVFAEKCIRCHEGADCPAVGSDRTLKIRHAFYSSPGSDVGTGVRSATSS